MARNSRTNKTDKISNECNRMKAIVNLMRDSDKIKKDLKAKIKDNFDGMGKTIEIKMEI